MIALVCIAKNEDHYIDEWIEYHLKLGYDRVFVYQNDWKMHDSKYEKSENVVWLTINGKQQQFNAYNNFLQMYSNQFDWVSYFDVDEFLVLKKTQNIKDFLEPFRKCCAVSINWKIFGSNGHLDIKDNNYSVINRFIKSQIGINRHVKITLNLKWLLEQDSEIFKKIPYVFSNPHCSIFNMANDSKFAVSPDMKYYVDGPFNEHGSDEFAYLAHFSLKSKAEYIARCSIGKADTGIVPKNIDELFLHHDLNEVDNFDVKNMFS